MITTPAVPQSAVGVDGGDVWSGQRVSQDGLIDIVEEATSTTVSRPIVAQYYPNRRWLWRQWRGTVIRRTLPREVLFQVLFAWLISVLFSASGPMGAQRAAVAESYLAGLARAWTLSATMASFLLSFFLSQSYALWRSVYSITRRVQGRLNDFCLLCATYAERNATTGAYTPAAEITLRTVSRYVRLFHMLFYASVTTRFAPLKTPQGLSELVRVGAITAEEREGLLESSMGHAAVVGWLSALVDTAVADGRLAVSVARDRDTSPIAVQLSLQNKLVDLRATYASLPDELTARMPLAYVQLVQLMTDSLCFFTPLALVHSVGPFGVVCGTLVVTLFHSSVVTLAKLFLDPLNNEVKDRGGDPGIGGIDVATLLIETNLGSERWRRSAAWLPQAVRRMPAADADADAAEPPQAEPEPGLMKRLFGVGTAPVASSSNEHAASSEEDSIAVASAAGGDGSDIGGESADVGSL